MKKKLLLALLAVVVCFTVTGCGNEENKSSKKTEKFEGTYKYNPPTDNYYIEYDGSVYAKVGEKYTYVDKSTEGDYIMHLNHDKKLVYTKYEGKWYIDSNLSYSEYEDDSLGYPLSAMEEHFMHYFRAYGFDDEKLKEYYVGTEKVAGVNCWVFDAKGLNAIYVKYWVDPSNGVTLKYHDYEGGDDDIVEVTKYDLNYKKMSDDLAPTSYDNIDSL